MNRRVFAIKSGARLILIIRMKDTLMKLTRHFLMEIFS
jgi:hypothetical protein